MMIRAVKYPVYHSVAIGFIINLSKSDRMYSPQVNPKVKYGFWVIMICQWRFICGKQCTILVGDVDNGVGYACRSRE